MSEGARLASPLAAIVNVDDPVLPPPGAVAHTLYVPGSRSLVIVNTPSLVVEPNVLSGATGVQAAVESGGQTTTVAEFTPEAPSRTRPFTPATIETDTATSGWDVALVIEPYRVRLPAFFTVHVNATFPATIAVVLPWALVSGGAVVGAGVIVTAAPGTAVDPAVVTVKL